MGADDADDADGCATTFSGVAEGWIVVMLMVRVRALPSRPKPTSMPTFRKNVAARRSLPDSARGLSGQVLDLAARSPTASPRASRLIFYSCGAGMVCKSLILREMRVGFRQNVVPRHDTFVLMYMDFDVIMC